MLSSAALMKPMAASIFTKAHPIRFVNTNLLSQRYLSQKTIATSTQINGVIKTAQRCPLSRTNLSQKTSRLHHRASTCNSVRTILINQRTMMTGREKTPPKLGMWQRWIAPREMPPRQTLRWYGEMVLLCTVFAITGSSSLVLVRPAVSKGLGLQGSMKDGPWSYRICSLVIMTPIYTVLLVAVGTVFGRHAYFRHFAVKMISRFGIPPEMLDQGFHRTSKTFRKW